MDFYGEASSTDKENINCKTCINRGDTQECLNCIFHEWNSEYKGREKEFGLKDLYKKNPKK